MNKKQFPNVKIINEIPSRRHALGLKGVRSCFSFQSLHVEKYKLMFVNAQLASVYETTAPSLCIALKIQSWTEKMWLKNLWKTKIKLSPNPHPWPQKEMPGVVIRTSTGGAAATPKTEGNFKLSKNHSRHRDACTPTTRDHPSDRMHTTGKDTQDKPVFSTKRHGWAV